jgi:hypothetical protein
MLFGNFCLFHRFHTGAAGFQRIGSAILLSRRLKAESHIVGSRECDAGGLVCLSKIVYWHFLP